MDEVEERAPAREELFLDRRAFGVVGLNWEIALYLSILGLAFVLRFWDLGYRMLHHDESIHGVYSWYLYSGRGYVHNPTFHGPFLYHITALVYLLFGVSDYTARMAPAIFGLVLVALPYLLRKELGRNGALMASFLLAVSPSILYYSRSLRHDIFAATGTILLFIALWRYVDDRRSKWLFLGVGGLLLGFTNHELTFITVFILVIFLAVFTAAEWLSVLLRSRRLGDLSPEASFLLFVGTIVAPLFAPAVLIPVQLLRLPVDTAQATLIAWFAFAVLAIVSAAVGCCWNARIWPYAALLFYGVAVLLFTSFFTNPRGVETGLLGSLQYWLTQHEVSRGGQPFYYYIALMPLYEFLPLIFGFAGVVYTLVRRNRFRLFLTYWFLSSFIIYSWAGEKMPWLLIHITIPCVLLAALFLGKVIGKIDWKLALQKGVGQWALLLCLLAGAVVSLFVIGSPLRPAATALEGQRHLLQWSAAIVALLVVGVLVTRQARRLGGSMAPASTVLVAFGLVLPLWVHTSTQVNFYNGDIPVEMLVYVQSSPDVGKVMREIERIGFRTGVGKDLKVAYDSGVSWPFEWYLRDYRNRAFFGAGSPPADAPVVLVGFEDNHDQQIKAQLGDRYVGQRYKLRWWFPEDYKSAAEWVRALQGSDTRSVRSESIGLGDVIRTMLQPESIEKLWRYFIFRETLSPLGSTDFMMYVRKDLASGLWAATATTGRTSPQADVYESKVRSLTPVDVWGSLGAGAGQFDSPKGIAVGPDGSIYVADSRNNRVQKFDSSGRYLRSWGTGGKELGQFAEPWGVAVDSRGDVYVADWWNHRVQKFDSQGRVITAWGTYGLSEGVTDKPGSFYGPRAIAVDQRDRVYVVDTGNHRVQVFDSNGRFLSAYGGRGSGDGQFQEPVGIAIDDDGFIYVADTWNRRVQRFDSEFRLANQWPIVGWESESAVNKPYLAIDHKGGVYVTDPENHRVLRFDAAGAVRTVWGKAGFDLASFNLPTGIACDDAGSVLVVDSGNHRIVRYAPLD